MIKFFRNYIDWPAGKDLSALAIRLVFGLGMILGHGLGKWQKFVSGDPIQFADPIGIGQEISLGMAVFAEVFCGILIVLGLLTRWAVLPLLFTMVVALFVIHAADDYSVKEKALLYSIGYLSLIFTGPGKYSVDYLLLKK